MVVDQHSAELLAPYDRTERFVDANVGPQQLIPGPETGRQNCAPRTRALTGDGKDKRRRFHWGVAPLDATLIGAAR